MSSVSYTAAPSFNLSELLLTAKRERATSFDLSPIVRASRRARGLDFSAAMVVSLAVLWPSEESDLGALKLSLLRRARARPDFHLDASACLRNVKSSPSDLLRVDGLGHLYPARPA